MPRPLWLLPATLLSLAFAPAPFPKAERKAPRQAVTADDLDALQGTWVEIPAWKRQAARRRLPQRRLVVSGTRLTFYEATGELERAWDVTLDAATVPREMTLKLAPASKGKTFKATYTVNSNSFTLTYPVDFAEGRPTAVVIECFVRKKD